MPLIIFSIVLFLAPLLSALPEEPIWSLFFGTLVLAAAAIKIFEVRAGDQISKSQAGIIALPVIALLSLLYHWLVVHKGAPAYLDVMIRGSLFWLSAAAAFFLASFPRSRIGGYVTILAIVAGASVAAGIGFQDYLFHLRHHEAQWREFGTSTPDFFAGQLVMTFPIAFALFLGSKSGKGHIFWLPYIVAFLLQLAVIPTTGSRFALISIIVGVAALLASFAVSIRSGMKFPKEASRRLAALAIIVVLGGAVVAKPILSRLQSGTLQTQAHSGDFRAWTWKGTWKLIKANPVLGSGPGTFVYAYPKRALVGFTRHAHSAYLQTAADLGLPALIVMLCSFGAIVIGGFAQLGNKITSVGPTETETASSELFDQIEVIDDRFLTAGVIGSLAAALAQNLIDSDWFTFASGITLFALAGSLASMLTTKKRTVPIGSVKYGALTVYIVGTVVSALWAAAELQNQLGNYASATALNPLSSTYQASAAMKLYLPQHDLANTESTLVGACKLAPDATSYHRLGTFYLEDSRPNDALNAFCTGLNYDPNSIQLLLSTAELSSSLGNQGAALGYYQHIADLESSPFGTVRAIPEVTETRFADADAAIGQSLLTRGLPQQAIPYFERARDDCEEYSSDGGAAQAMRTALNQGVVDTDLDNHMRSLYIGVLNNLALAYFNEGKVSEAEATKAHLNTELKSFPGS